MVDMLMYRRVADDYLNLTQFPIALNEGEH